MSSSRWFMTFGTASSPRGICGGVGYWSVLAGAFGFTYGANGVWQMDRPGRVFQWSHFNYYWDDALNYEGSHQMTYLRGLFESRPALSPERIPDQQLVASPKGSIDDRVQASRARDGSYAILYITSGDSVLLLDEPFGVLDARVRKQLREWLRNLHNEVKVTTLLVTHDSEEACEVADRVAVIHEGRIAQIVAAGELAREPATPFLNAFLDAAPQARASRPFGVAPEGTS